MNFLSNIFRRFVGKVLTSGNLGVYIENLMSGGEGVTVNDAYGKVDVVNACIMAKWTALDSISWAVYDSENNLVENYSAIHLLNAPNPQMTRTQFLAWTVISLDLTGKAFFWIDANEAGTPVALWPLVAKNMQPIFSVHPQTGSQVVQAWRYNSPSGKPVVFLPEELLSFRYPHPTEAWNGLARLAPADSAVNQFHASTTFQERSFANDGVVSGVLAAKQPLSDAQLLQAREAFQAHYSGTRNAKKTLVVGSDWEYKRMALSPQELDFLNSSKWSLQRIAMALGVPLPVIGIQGDSALGSGKENETHYRGFWINTQLPLMMLVESSVDAQLLGNPLWVWPTAARRNRKGCSVLTARALRMARAKSTSASKLFLGFNRDEVTVLIIERNSLLEAAAKMWGMGVPLADINDYYQLGLPERPWYQQGYLPFSVAAVGSDVSLDAGATTSQETEVESVFSRLERACKCLAHEQKADTRKHSWQYHNAKIEKNAKRLRGAFKAHFVRQRMEMLRKLGAQSGGKAIQKSLFAEIIFDLAGENARLTASVKPILRGIFDEAGKEQLQELDSANTYQMTPRAEAYFKQMLKNAEEVNRTTRDRLQEALDEGELDSLDAVAEKIREIYRDRENNGAKVSGESMSVGAYNGARTDAQRQAGIEKQEWLSARDERVRPTHQAADGQIVGIDEPFDVGGEQLMYPGDPRGSLEEVINCRCVAVPVME